MKPREKQEAMAAFAAGGADVLVATTVIEVGIDVPNASVMLVEGAERYGISQLHQLRGRIGRGRTSRSACSSGRRSRRGCARSPSTATASSSPRSTSSCAGRGRCWAPASPASPSSASRGCRRTPSCSTAARRIGAALLEADPELAEPEHALLEEAVGHAYGADALDPIPA